jgi:hypothetical protein
MALQASSLRRYSAVLTQTGAAGNVRQLSRLKKKQHSALCMAI